MGAFLDKPKTEKHCEHGSGNGLSFGLCSMQGWRIEMEDAHCAIIGLPNGLKDWSFFAVFDGHAGARVSAHCAQNLLDTIIQAEEFPSNTKNGNSQVSVEDAECVKQCIREGFLKLDERMKKIPEIASGEDKSGSTAVCALISSTHYYFANCGDSRAVLSHNSQDIFSTQDHKPINPGEKKRIQKAGGSVMVERVNGSLAVSRALGDYEYKQVEGVGPCEQLVSPEPEVTVKERDNSLDEFLVLACDGVWDVMTNKDLCDYIRHMMYLTSDLESICSSVVDSCLSKGSKDNMSIVLVALPAAPQVSEQHIQEDKELNKTLKKAIKRIVVGNPEGKLQDRPVLLMDVNDLMRNLIEVDDEEQLQLPRGGKLWAKHSYIKEVYESLKNNTSTQEDEQT